jgi:2-polyprenyl-6-hydroxyphenyl methylase/3-demethylubiquinone-9 3-methyltransferase
MSHNESVFEELPLNKRYGFGKNWEKFIERHYNDERVASSIRVFQDFTKLSSLEGKSFIDVGCGSGLHSLGAHRQRATEIFAFDYDPNSVKITKELWKRESQPKNWQTVQGSILDREFLSTLKTYDFVYSWGVLHHTGAVWKAISNTCELVNQGGSMYLALYSLDVQPNAQYWLDKKLMYVNSNRLKRILIELWYIFKYVRPAVYLKILFGLGEKRTRGMDFLTDIRDWLGGWPMEFVYDAEVIKFVEVRGFDLENINKGEACTEFFFKRK